MPVTCPVSGRRALRLGDVGVDAFPGLGDDGSGGGQDRARRRALDEFEAHLLLKLLDLLGDRRGGDHEDVSGGDDAAFARYR